MGGNFENHKCEEYLNRWSWRSIFECNEPYNDTIVAAFYANMKKTDINEVPWGFHTYVCGKSIDCTLPKMAGYLGLVNDGEEVYLNNSWLTGPNVPKVDDYLKWFRAYHRFHKTTLGYQGERIRGREPSFLASSLPSIHRLAFAFLNYIVTPKGGFKTNIEHHNLFYLRHLLDGSNRLFNIPFVITSHMRATFTDGRRILPYANLITRILKANGIELGNVWDKRPKNLWDDLKSNGWKLESYDETTGARVYKTKGKLMDEWIRAPNAKPNQYTDPALGTNENDGESVDSDEEGGTSHTSTKFQNSVLTALGTLTTSMGDLSTQNREIRDTQKEILTNQVSIKETLTDYGVRLGHIEENNVLFEKGYNAFYDWTKSEFKPFYEDYQGLKERYVTRFGGDDDDLNNPGQSSGFGGDGDDGDDGDNDQMED